MIFLVYRLHWHAFWMAYHFGQSISAQRRYHKIEHGMTSVSMTAEACRTSAHYRDTAQRHINRASWHHREMEARRWVNRIG